MPAVALAVLRLGKGPSSFPIRQCLFPAAREADPLSQPRTTATNKQGIRATSHKENT